MSSQYALATGAISVNEEPYLAVDEVYGVNPKMEAVTWNAIEVDQVRLDALPGINTDLKATNEQIEQNEKFVLRGFDNKFVNRLTLLKEPTVTTNSRFGNLNSPALVGEKIQFVINGHDYLPYEGIDRPNKRLARLTDTWGTFNTVMGMNEPWLHDAANMVDNAGDIVGQLDYTSVTVAQRINELGVNFTRTAVYDSSAAGGQDQTIYNQPLNLHFAGEVAKQIAPVSGGYEVRYL